MIAGPLVAAFPSLIVWYLAVSRAALALADAPVAGAGPLAVGPPMPAHPLRITPTTAATVLSQVLCIPSIVFLLTHTLDCSQKRCQGVCEVDATVLGIPGHCLEPQ